MSNNSLDKISWELVEIVKETVKKNLIAAINTEKVDIKEDVLPTLFNLLDASFSEGYSKSHKNFSTKIEKFLSETANINEVPVPKKRK